MRKLIFLACILISFNTIQAQPQCENMLNEVKNTLSNDRPQDFEAASDILQTFSKNWQMLCDKNDEGFIVLFDELTEFLDHLRGKKAANEFNFSFNQHFR